MNNSKQTILSIVGIAILVIAVVGVSFAFFSYSRTGTTNNVITTGSLTFEYEETSASALSLTNRFPQTDSEGAAETSAFAFDVKGTVPTTANAINYKVYVVPGATEAGKQRFLDDQISIKVTATNGGVVESAYQTAGALSSSISTNKGIQIGHGTINATGVEQQHDYTLKMWVNSTVTISDTDYRQDYRAKAYNATSWPEMPAQHSASDATSLPDGKSTDDRKVYSDMYYSVKVNVEADDVSA